MSLKTWPDAGQKALYNIAQIVIFLCLCLDACATVENSNSTLVRFRRLAPILPPLPDPPYECYQCRSDKHPDCARGVNTRHIQICNTKTFEDFVQNLVEDKLMKPLPKYERTTGIEDKQWACYTMMTTDKLIVVRSCAVVDKSDPNDCKPCKMLDSQVYNANCCVCKNPRCNNKSSGAPSFPNSNETIIILIILNIIVIPFNK